MVKPKKAFIISALSAIAVGAIHFAAHRYAPDEHQVVIAGTAVVVSTFAIGFIGMLVGN